MIVCRCGRSDARAPVCRVGQDREASAGPPERCLDPVIPGRAQKSELSARYSGNGETEKRWSRRLSGDSGRRRRTERVNTVPKRRCFQYSLRALLLVVLFASIGMSWFATKIGHWPRYRGIVQCRVGADRSGTGSSADLFREALRVEFDDGDGKKTDVSVRWEMVRRRGTKDVYRFRWWFGPTIGEVLFCGTAEVEYDGETPAVVFSNNSLTLSIEPMSPIPSHSENPGAQQRAHQ